MKSLIVGFVTVTIVLGLLYFFKKEDKTAYVQIQKVFNEFEYKKEMEAKLKNVKEVRKRELDSLEIQLKVLFKEIELNRKDANKIASFQKKKDEFVTRKDVYEGDYEKTVATYDEIIIKQINQYIKEYGESKNYTYIFGTDGKGNLMFADSTHDITTEVISFINKKFRGATK